MEYTPKLIVCGASSYPRTIDFKNTIIIMTSNLGTNLDIKNIGFLPINNNEEIEVHKKITSNTHSTFIEIPLQTGYNMIS